MMIRQQLLEFALKLANAERGKAAEWVAKGQFAPFLPLLEWRWVQIEAELSWMDECELLQVLGTNFPYFRLVYFALSSSSPYWQSKAIIWLEKDDFEIDDQIASLLEKLAKDKQVSGLVRQRASATLQRWRHAQNNISS